MADKLERTFEYLRNYKVAEFDRPTPKSLEIAVKAFDDPDCKHMQFIPSLAVAFARILDKVNTQFLVIKPEHTNEH